MIQKLYPYYCLLNDQPPLPANTTAIMQGYPCGAPECITDKVLDGHVCKGKWLRARTFEHDYDGDYRNGGYICIQLNTNHRHHCVFALRVTREPLVFNIPAQKADPSYTLEVSLKGLSVPLTSWWSLLITTGAWAAEITCELGIIPTAVNIRKDFLCRQFILLLRPVPQQRPGL